VRTAEVPLPPPIPPARNSKRLARSLIRRIVVQRPKWRARETESRQESRRLRHVIRGREDVLVQHPQNLATRSLRNAVAVHGCDLCQDRLRRDAEALEHVRQEIADAAGKVSLPRWDDEGKEGDLRDENHMPLGAVVQDVCVPISQYGGRALGRLLGLESESLPNLLGAPVRDHLVPDPWARAPSEHSPGCPREKTDRATSHRSVHPHFS